MKFFATFLLSFLSALAIAAPLPESLEKPKVEEVAKLVKSNSGDTCWLVIPGKTVRYSISGFASRPAHVQLSGIMSLGQTDQYIHVGFYNRMEDYRFSSPEAAAKVFDEIVKIMMETECFR